MKYVAVKVLTVNGTLGNLNGHLGELDCLKTIKAANPNHPGYKHCLILYDAFNAAHIVLNGPIATPTKKTLTQEGPTSPPLCAGSYSWPSVVYTDRYMLCGMLGEFYDPVLYVDVRVSSR